MNEREEGRTGGKAEKADAVWPLFLYELFCVASTFKVAFPRCGLLSLEPSPQGYSVKGQGRIEALKRQPKLLCSGCLPVIPGK